MSIWLSTSPVPQDTVKKAGGSHEGRRNQAPLHEGLQSWMLSFRVDTTRGNDQRLPFLLVLHSQPSMASIESFGSELNRFRLPGHPL